MIKEQLIKNNVTGPNTREIDKLKRDFPQYFDADGKFMIDRFNDFITTNNVEITKEGFELKFLGKSYAKLLTSLNTKTVISPILKHNSEPVNSQSENLYIVGDNLDAIKHLLKSYTGRIKCIYIDPPYNTGKDDFVYSDNFEFTKENLANATGVNEDEAERILNISGKSTHSAWLTFMYPRLLLARELLSDDGVIFISIDDNEQANLKLICDEIFYENNFEGHIHWRRRHNQPNDKTKMIGLVAEHIIAYSKDKEKFKAAGVGKIDLTGNFNNPDNDPKGDWASKPWKVGSDQSGSKYKITTPTGRVLDEEWMGDYGTYKKFLHESRIYFPRNGDGMPRKKYYKFEREEEGQCATNWWSHEEFGNNQKANDLMTDLFGTKNIFSNPKPIELIRGLIQIANVKDNDIVLDFFSGSASTAHAVMQLNSEDQLKRIFIMVQSPEKIKEKEEAYREGYRTIDEIGQTRIKKAAEKIKVETNAKIDYGFKLYKLNTPEQKTLDKLVDFDPVAEMVLDDMINIFSFENIPGKETILTSWLNEDGYGLGVVPKIINLKNYEADLYDGSLYIIEEGITSEDVMELIKKIENNDLLISRIVVYPYSLPFNQSHELKKNIANLRQNKNVTVIERY